MNKRSLALLERAFVAEVEEGAEQGLGLIQTRSRLAEILEEDGFLEKASHRIGGSFPCVVNGYRLTHLGRLTYCSSCCKEDAKESDE